MALVATRSVESRWHPHNDGRTRKDHLVAIERAIPPLPLRWEKARPRVRCSATEALSGMTTWDRLPGRMPTLQEAPACS
jgi:hypothetical protein